jgi:RNA recognition motif-containing protein
VNKSDSNRSGASRNPQPFNPQGLETVKLYVGNVAQATTAETIQSVFEQYGAVTDCFMPTDRETGVTRGFCFVSMS